MTENSLIYKVEETWPLGLQEKWSEKEGQKSRDQWLAEHGQFMLGLTFEKDGKTISLFDRVEIIKGTDRSLTARNQGSEEKVNIVYTRTYHTDQERFEYYNENHRKTVFESSNKDFEGINGKKSPVKFLLADSVTRFELLQKMITLEPGPMINFSKKEASFEGGFQALPLTIYSKSADTPVIYGVRINVKAGPELNPPYGDWLKEHIDGSENMAGMMQLKYGNGDQPIFTGARAFERKFPDGTAAYLAEYNVTEGALAHYITTEGRASAMRSAADKSFEGALSDPGSKYYGVFSFDRETIALQGATKAQRDEYARLLEINPRVAGEIDFKPLLDRGFTPLKDRITCRSVSA